MTPPIIPPRMKFCTWSVAELGARFPFPVTLITKTKETSPKANLIAIVIKKLIIFQPPQVQRLTYIIQFFLTDSYLVLFRQWRGRIVSQP